MSLDKKFPSIGTKEELLLIGARHLVTDPIEINGIRGRIEYMIYERDGHAVIWKKPINENKYLIHEEMRIEKKYPVPAITDKSNSTL